MKKIKPVKAWTVWNNDKDEPWGVICWTDDMFLGCYGVFETKADAIKYRVKSGLQLKTNKIIPIVINPLSNYKKN